MRIQCEHCGRAFEFKPKRIKVMDVGNGYQESFLQCPNNKCKSRYTVSYTSKESRELQKEWKKEGSIHGTETHKRLLKELRKVNDYMRNR